MTHWWVIWPPIPFRFTALPPGLFTFHNVHFNLTAYLTATAAAEVADTRQKLPQPSAAASPITIHRSLNQKPEQERTYTPIHISKGIPESRRDIFFLFPFLSFFSFTSKYQDRLYAYRTLLASRSRSTGISQVVYPDSSRPRVSM